jgi:hypothetical protein
MVGTAPVQHFYPQLQRAAAAAAQLLIPPEDRVVLAEAALAITMPQMLGVQATPHLHRHLKAIMVATG